MARFSDLPNELIINIWSYLVEPQVEPQSVESFALVSKRIYELATPFVEEHQRLRQQYAKILDLEKGKRGRAADLLEAILLNPRVAVYINELQIRGWANFWEDEDDFFQSKPYAAKTMDIFEKQVQSLSHIDLFKAEYWVEDMRLGHEGPLLTLILIRLTKLKRLEIYPCNSDPYTDGSLDMILGGWYYSLETSAPRRLNGACSPFPKSFHISDLVIKFCNIELRTISDLLRNTKNLKRFSYYGTWDFLVEPHQIYDYLLKYSRQSLQKLCLKYKGRIEIGEKYTIRDTICRFEKLVELEMDINFWLDSEYDGRDTSKNTLPTSFRKITFSSTEVIALERINDVTLEMVKSKKVHLPNLKALTFEQSSCLGPHDDTTAPVIRTELRDTESFADLSQKLAEVGVFLSVTVYEYPNSWDDQAAFQAYMS